MEKFGDPGFARHRAVTQLLGLAIIRSADNLILPLNITYYAKELMYYAEAVKKAANVTSPKFGSFDKLNFNALDTSLQGILSASQTLDAQIASIQALHQVLTQKYNIFARLRDMMSWNRSQNRQQLTAKVRSINGKLKNFEGNFIDEAGLDGRTWYKHREWL